MHTSQNCDATNSLTLLWDVMMFEYVGFIVMAILIPEWPLVLKQFPYS